MAQIIRVRPGVTTSQDGTYNELRGTRKGGLVSQDVGGRYEESTYRGSAYSITTVGGGVQLAATHLFSTAIATFTPILALYNPLTNTKAFSILQAWCGLVAAPLATITQTGGFFFVGQSGQSISNAQSATPLNNYTLKQSGSSAIGVTNVALAGAVGNPILIRPISAVAELVTATANATGVVGAILVEDVGGSLIVPPGGYVGFANGISNAVAGHLVSAGMIFEEIPL